MIIQTITESIRKQIFNLTVFCPNLEVSIDSDSEKKIIIILYVEISVDGIVGVFET